MRGREIMTIDTRMTFVRFTTNTLATQSAQLVITPQLHFHGTEVKFHNVQYCAQSFV